MGRVRDWGRDPLARPSADRRAEDGTGCRAAAEDEEDEDAAAVAVVEAALALAPAEEEDDDEVEVEAGWGDEGADNGGERSVVGLMSSLRAAPGGFAGEPCWDEVLKAAGDERGHGTAPAFALDGAESEAFSFE
jgi:hypothetical protein